MEEYQNKLRREKTAKERAVTEQEGKVSAIQHFCIHDGPGIRTTVFLKGCPLHCIWCHNPECIQPEPELMFYDKRCIRCGICARLCSRGGAAIDGSGFHIRPEICRQCPDKGLCAEHCPTGARQICGETMTADEVMREVQKDRIFYGQEGGVTVSGGEPMLQPEFTRALLAMCRGEGISTAVETALSRPFSVLECFLEYTDWILADLKFTDPERSLRYTGTDGTTTLNSLRRLSAAGRPVILRMPILPGVNDTEEELRARRALLRELSNVVRVDCFAVQNYGKSKYKALGQPVPDLNSGQDADVRVRAFEDKLLSRDSG